jgi:hypothetical protein
MNSMERSFTLFNAEKSSIFNVKMCKKMENKQNLKYNEIIRNG